MSRLQLAVEQIRFARDYTIWLLDQTPATEWFGSLQAASAISPGRSATWRLPSTALYYAIFEVRGHKTPSSSRRSR